MSVVGCGADGHRSALSLIRIVGMEGMRFGVIEIDGRTVGHELTVLSLVGHIGEACAGDADAVAVGPLGSFRIDAGSGRNVGDKLGGYRAVIQVLVVVVTGGKCQCQRCESKKSGSHCKSVFYILYRFCYRVTFTSSASTSSQPVISNSENSASSGVSTSVPPRVRGSVFFALTSLRASERSLSSIVGRGLPSA